MRVVHLTALILALGLASRAAGAAEPVATPFTAKIDAAKSAMMAEPAKAYTLAKAAGVLADREPPGGQQTLDRATADWLAAEALTRNKHADQALPILDKALAVVAATAPGTKLHGDVLKSRGQSAASLGKVQSALQDYQSAYTIFQHAGEPRSQAMTLQEIGSIYADARDYPHVLQYYTQARDVFSKDPILTLTADNNLGYAFKDMGKYPEAEAEFRKALTIAKPMHSGDLEAQILNNIAFVETLEGKRTAARDDARRGLAIAARDPEAKDEIPFLNGVLAKVAADSGDDQSAARLLDGMFSGVDIGDTPMEYRDFHELAARVYEAAGQRDKALDHLKAFKRLDDEGRKLAASTNTALMSAKFDFANLKASQAQARAQFTLVITVILSLGGLIVTSLITHAFFSMRRSRNRIRVVNEQLSTSNTALEKALKAKTEFLATTSHEIRTPLNGILGMTQVMLADAGLSAPNRERLGLLKSAGDTMSALVNDLLDVAKIETGALTVERTPFDLKRLLQDSAKVWADQATGKGLAFETDFDGCPDRIVDDADRMRQVLFNLMANAAKFTETGSIRLSARAEPDGAGEALMIAVADTGIGIAPEDQERIFESFVQVDGAKTRQYAGTGLGLAICRNVATALGGTILVESAPGQGSTFTLRLPLTRAEGGAGNDAGEPRGLLVLDSNPLAQAMLRAFLQDKLDGIDFVETLEAAEATIATGAHRAVLVDGACLQRLSPEDPIEAFAALARSATVGVSVLWPAPTADEEARLAAAGAVQVLVKPIAPMALWEALRKVHAFDRDESRSKGYAA